MINYSIERLQAKRRVRIKRQLRRLGVTIPASATYNLGFLQLLLCCSKRRNELDTIDFGTKGETI